MSNVQPTVIAVLCSDLHICHEPPMCRSDEPDWYATMAGYFKQLKDLSHRHFSPIICAGDVFDRWQSIPELINFAIEHLPAMYAIPGQHDLPYHGMEAIKRSAYWSLVGAGVLTHLTRPTKLDDVNLAVHPFPWNAEASPITPFEGCVNLALIHRYCWVKEHSYVGADQINHAKILLNAYGAADVLHFGDNHSGFLLAKKHRTILNTGTFMRRTVSEVDYRPRVGLLHDDGSVVLHYLDTSSDVMSFTTKLQGADIDDVDVVDFVRSLKLTEQDSIDFVDLLKQKAADECKEVQDEIRLIIELASA